MQPSSIKQVQEAKNETQQDLFSILMRTNQKIITLNDLRDIIHRMDSWKCNPNWFKKRINYSLAEIEDLEHFQEAFEQVLFTKEPTTILNRG